MKEKKSYFAKVSPLQTLCSLNTAYNDKLTCIVVFGKNRLLFLYLLIIKRTIGSSFVELKCNAKFNKIQNI